MGPITKDSKITIGLVATIMAIVVAAAGQFFWAMNTLASKEFVEEKVQDKVETVIVRIKGVEYTIERVHDDVKYIRQRIDRK